VNEDGNTIIDGIAIVPGEILIVTDANSFHARPLLPACPNSHDRDFDVADWGERIEQAVPLLTTLPPHP